MIKTLNLSGQGTATLPIFSFPIISSCTKRDMNTSFLVVDNEFNRCWNNEIVGLRFEVPPSYTAVLECDVKADYKDYQAWRNRNG